MCCLSERDLAKVKNHIYCGNKYKDAKDKVAKKEVREHDIADSLVAFDKSGLPAVCQCQWQRQRVFQVKVVKNFLKAGIPLARVVGLKALLEEMDGN